MILLLFTLAISPTNNYAVYGKKNKSGSNSNESSSQDNTFVLKAEPDNSKPIQGVKVKNKGQASSSQTLSQDRNSQGGNSGQTSKAKKVTAASASQTLNQVTTNVPSDCAKETKKAFTVSQPYGGGYSVGCAAGYKDGKNGNPCSNDVPANPYNYNDDPTSNVNWKSGYSNGYGQGHNIAVNGNPNVDSCNQQSTNTSDAENHPFTQLLGSGSQSNNNNKKPDTNKRDYRISVTKNPFDGSTTTTETSLLTGFITESTHRLDGTTMELGKDQSGNLIHNYTTTPGGNWVAKSFNSDGSVGLMIIKDKDRIITTSYYPGVSNHIKYTSVDYKNNLTTTTWFNPDSSLESKETEYQDGTKTTMKSDGTITTDKPDGTWFITFPKKSDGSVEIYYSDGSTKTKKPDGTIVP